jgi:hypothetical protein
MRALRAVDASIHHLYRVLRRAPEHRYDLYILSDHGQAHCTPYETITGGRHLEHHLFEQFLAPAGAHEVAPGRPHGRHLSTGIKALRRSGVTGIVQRFVNYLEHDFPWRLGEVKEAHEHDGVRVIAAGPNAFVYFLDDPAALTHRQIKCATGLAEDVPAPASVVLAATGVRCASGAAKRYRPEELGGSVHVATTSAGGQRHRDLFGDTGV